MVADRLVVVAAEIEGHTASEQALRVMDDELYAVDGGLEFHRIKSSMVVEGGSGIDFAMLKYPAAAANARLPALQLPHFQPYVAARLPQNSP
jgi:hypothetical protein